MHNFLFVFFKARDFHLGFFGISRVHCNRIVSQIWVSSVARTITVRLAGCATTDIAEKQVCRKISRRLAQQPEMWTIARAFGLAPRLFTRMASLRCRGQCTTVSPSLHRIQLSKARTLVLIQFRILMPPALAALARRFSRI